MSFSFPFSGLLTVFTFSMGFFYYFFCVYLDIRYCIYCSESGKVPNELVSYSDISLRIERIEFFSFRKSGRFRSEIFF